MWVDVFIQTSEGNVRTQSFDSSDPITVGRAAECGVVLDGQLVSRRHATLVATENGLRVEDSSSNGTLVGDSVLRKSVAEVPYGTTLVVGTYVLRLFPASGSSRAVKAVPRSPSDGPRPLASKAEVPPSVSMSEPTAEVRAYTTAPPEGPSAGFGERVVPPPGRMPTPSVAPLPSKGGAASGVSPSPRPSSNAPPLPLPRPHGAPSMDDRAANPAPRVEASDLGAQATLRREIHRRLLENMDLAAISPSQWEDPSLRPRVIGALRRIVASMDDRLPPEVDRGLLVGELTDEVLGLGPLEQFLSDPAVSEIMVVDPSTIFVERHGRIELTRAHFTDDVRVRACIERIVTPLGRRIDESSPLVDARLPDGSRVHAVIRPIALRGTAITIRKFGTNHFTLDDLIASGTLSVPMGRFLTRSVVARRNIVISGGTGSGKTTLLNILSSAIPPTERIVTIEDAAELRLKQRHVVSLESRPANMEGRGEQSIRELVRNALRMRPDRIVIGECRGGEALDMLQAMNTGHDGSLTTTHANSPEEAVARLETLALMAGVDLPVRAIRGQIAASIHLVVQQTRFPDGTRRVTHIAEVTGLDEDTGHVLLQPLFEFRATGTDEKGRTQGKFRATGYLPTFLDLFLVRGLIAQGEPYL